MTKCTLIIKVLANSETVAEFIHYGNTIYGLDEFKPIITIKKNGRLPNGADKGKTHGFINNELKTPASDVEIKKEEEKIDKQFKKIQ